MTAKHNTLSRITGSPKKSALIWLLACAIAFGPAAQAAAATLPAGGTITSGTGSISSDGAKMQIDQSTGKMVINWQSYNIGKDGWVNYSQPSASSVALNRVLSSDPSRIFGKLTANGQVILVNPNGVLFGKGARVDVGAITASSLNIRDNDFLAGKYSYFKDGAAGSVINQGSISAAQGGYIALLGPQAANEGVLSAGRGTVALGAGERISLDMYGDGLVKLSVDQGALNASINNKGSIRAEGGQVYLSARATGDVLSTVVNNEGVIQATSLVGKNGTVVLDGGDNGLVRVFGTIDVSGKNAGRTGGTAKVLGKEITIGSGALVDASGDRGGGTVLVGGNFQGKGPEPNAQAVTIDTGARINADALTNGNGGKAAVWSDGSTIFNGSISARGGALSGDGGCVETSGHKLDIGQGALVGTLAPRGKNGTWLLDPADFTIYSLGYSGNMLNTDLSNALAGGNVQILSSDGTAGGSGDINVNGDVSWSDNTLTLTAARHININSVLTASGTSSLIMNTSTANGGDAAVAGGRVRVGYSPDGTYSGRVDFGSRSGAGLLTINGQDYTVINSLGSAGSTTGADLQGISGNLSGCYALGADIDASTTYDWNGHAGFAPLGNSATPFTGIFDGLGHIIKGIYIFVNAAGTPDAGLFGNTGAASQINNLCLTGGCIISNMYTLNDVVGGIAGTNRGSINNSYNANTVSGSSGSPSVRANVGGLVGHNYGNITESYNMGNVTHGVSIGGLAGNNEGAITSSYNSGQVGGNNIVYAGGLVGENSGNIAYSYNAGPVMSYTNGAIYNGGVIGYALAGSSMDNCYNTGYVWGISGSRGGLSGSAGTTTNSYWDMETSGQASNPGGGTGLTHAQMMSQADFAGWDFSGAWGIKEGYSYPYLRWRFPSEPQIISGYFTTGAAGDSLHIVKDGLDLGSASLSANITGGKFYHFTLNPNSLSNNNPFVVYFSNSPTKGGTIYASDISGNRYAWNNIISPNIFTESANFSNSGLKTLYGANYDVNSNLFNVDASNNLLVQGNLDFVTSLGTDHTLDGNITTHGGWQTYNGTLGNFGGSRLLSSAQGITIRRGVDAGTNALSLSANGIISQNAANSAITAGTLNVNNVAADTTLNGNNLIANLGTVTATGRNFTLTNAAGLNLAGNISTGAGGGSVNLTAGGALSQSGGAITTGTLRVTNSAGDTALNGNNLITNLVATATGRNFSFRNSTDLTLTGNITTGIGTGSVTLMTGGALSQSTGVITTGTLNVTNTADDIILDGNNVIANLGTVTATGRNFTLKDTAGLRSEGNRTGEEGGGTCNPT